MCCLALAQHSTRRFQSPIEVDLVNLIAVHGERQTKTVWGLALMGSVESENVFDVELDKSTFSADTVCLARFSITPLVHKITSKLTQFRIVGTNSLFTSHALISLLLRLLVLISLMTTWRVLRPLFLYCRDRALDNLSSNLSK
jgi:hypothetical protein